QRRDRRADRAPRRRAGERRAVGDPALAVGADGRAHRAGAGYRRDHRPAHGARAPTGRGGRVNDELTELAFAAGWSAVRRMPEGLAVGGAVMVLPHMANWDHAGAWACVRYGSLTTVAERLKPEGLYERFLSYRRALGMEVLPLSGEGGPFRTLLERARQGHL